jgi:tetratricopeptide (TPR) repeat protein
MSRVSKSTAEQKKLREEALRPCSLLGYDHESLANYLISRDSFRIAESILKRAIWLNPFEPRFKKRLAECLLFEKKYSDAHECITRVLEQNPDDNESKNILKLIEVTYAANGSNVKENHGT